MRNELINYFEAHAYRPVQPLPLVTGIEIYGGLEFDDDTSQMGSNEYCIQASARVDDIDEKNKPGTLPLFHIIALSSAGGIRPNQSIDLSLKFIVDQLGLVPSRLRVTGTKNLLAHLPLLEKYGLQESQIRFVDFNDARAAGKGPGYLDPKAHPRSPSSET